MLRRVKATSTKPDGSDVVLAAANGRHCDNANKEILVKDPDLHILTSKKNEYGINQLPIWDIA